MAALFCAWDGGQIPSNPQYAAVYGTHSYPFTQNPMPYLWGGGGTSFDTLAAQKGVPITTYTVDFYNSAGGGSTGMGNFYFYPDATNGNPAATPWTNDGWDLSFYIAAPGRFTSDVTTIKSPGSTEGWMDIGANMMEYEQAINLAGNLSSNGYIYCDTTNQTSANCGGTGDCNGGGCVKRSSSMIGIGWEGGSWEGHGIQNGGTPTSPAYNEGIETQYGKAGFRCVRPVEPPP
jgi:hypothetical protein